MLQEENSASEENPASEEALVSKETPVFKEVSVALESDVLSNKSSLIVIAICVTLSMIFMKSGFLSLFYLAPLGYAVLVSGSMQITFAAVTVVNIIVTIFINLFNSGNSQSIFAGNLLLEIVYFSAIFFVFIWIAGGDLRSSSNIFNGRIFGTNKLSLQINNGKKIRTAYRFIISSVVITGAFFLFIWRNEIFNLFLNELSKTLIVLFTQSGILYESNTAPSNEVILELIKNISLRGGVFFSMLLMFFLNYQLSYAFLFLFKRFNNKAAIDVLSDKKPRFPLGIINFFAPYNTIWFLSGSLATVLITNFYKIQILEILAWNVFIICVIIFFTQGAGIVMHFMETKTAAFKLVVSVFLIFLIFSPLSLIAVIVLVFLGIAEIWLPIRARTGKLEGK